MFFNDIVSKLSYEIGIDIATSISLIASAVFLAFQINRQASKQQAERLAKEAEYRNQAVYWQRQQTYFITYLEAIRAETRLYANLHTALSDLAQSQARARAQEASEDHKTAAERAMRTVEGAVSAYSDWSKTFMQELLVYAPMDFVARMTRALDLYNITLDHASAGDIPGGHIARAAFEVHFELSVSARLIYADGSRIDAEGAILTAQRDLIVEDEGSSEVLHWRKFKDEMLRKYDTSRDAFRGELEAFAAEKNAKRRGVTPEKASGTEKPA